MLQWRLLTNGNQAYRVSTRAMLSGRLTTAWITSKFSNSAVLLSQAYAALQAKLSTSRTASTTSSTSMSTADMLASAVAAITPQTVRHPDCNFFRTSCIKFLNIQHATRHPLIQHIRLPNRPMSMRPLPIHVIITSERIARPPKAARYATSLPPNFDATLRD